MLALIELHRAPKNGLYKNEVFHYRTKMDGVTRVLSRNFCLKAENIDFRSPETQFREHCFFNYKCTNELDFCFQITVACHIVGEGGAGRCGQKWC